MCFQNNIEQLNKLRNRKRPITLWKTAQLDDKTGLAKTTYCGHSATWKRGTVVVPHKIRKPLKKGQYCSAGLYFRSAKRLINRYSSDVVIEATVKPQDIIGVSFDAQSICCVAATVVKAPRQSKTKRIEWLNTHISKAKELLEGRQKDMHKWVKEQETNEEALQQMLDEVEKLRKKTNKPIPAKNGD
jgi:hypothetical protein